MKKRTVYAGILLVAVGILWLAACGNNNGKDFSLTEKIDDHSKADTIVYRILDGEMIEYKVKQGGDGFSFVNIVSNNACGKLYMKNGPEGIIQKRKGEEWETVNGIAFASAARPDILRAGENPYCNERC